jgi:hypothetical protein
MKRSVLSLAAALAVSQALLAHCTSAIVAPP